MTNYWIFKANPKDYFIVHYFLDDFLRSNPGCEDWWPTGGFEGEFAQGDIAYIWKTLGEPKKEDAPDYFEWKNRRNWKRGQRGIYAIARITRTSFEGLPESYMKRFARYHASDAWRGRSTRPQWRVYFKYIENLVDNPFIYDSNLFEDKLPKINEALGLKGRGQGKPVFKLEPSEGEILYKLTGKKDIYPLESTHGYFVRLLKETGEKLGYATETECALGTFKHDVVWRPDSHSNPSDIFEVELSGNLRDALKRLESGINKWGAKGFLFVEKESDETTAKKQLHRLFQTIEPQITIARVSALEHPNEFFFEFLNVR